MTVLSIQQKINRLPPELLTEVDKLLDSLLAQYMSNEAKAQADMISDEEIDAACGLYKADRSVSLEEMEQAIIEGALNGNY